MKKKLRPTIGKRKAMLEQGQKANIIGGLGNLKWDGNIKSLFGFKKHKMITIQTEIITFKFQSFIIKNY